MKTIYQNPKIAVALYRKAHGKIDHHPRRLNRVCPLLWLALLIGFAALLTSCNSPAHAAQTILPEDPGIAAIVLLVPLCLALFLAINRLDHLSKALNGHQRAIAENGRILDLHIQRTNQLRVFGGLGQLGIPVELEGGAADGATICAPFNAESGTLVESYCIPLKDNGLPDLSKDCQHTGNYTLTNWTGTHWQAEPVTTESPA